MLRGVKVRLDAKGVLEVRWTHGGKATTDGLDLERGRAHAEGVVEGLGGDRRRCSKLVLLSAVARG